MKAAVHRLLRWSILTTGLGWILAGPVAAQTFTNLHHFNGITDGAAPYGELILSGTTLYGTTYAGGSASNGTIFSISIDGSGFTNLHSFATNEEGTPINSDGRGPYASLVLSGNILYGAAPYGGERYRGTMFRLNTDGSGFTLLHTFTGGLDGGEPYGNLILSGTTFYGTTGQDGSGGWGTVFAINMDGTGLTNLHSFTSAPDDGDGPEAGVILSGNTLYGTTIFGGSANYGNVFRVNIDGSGFTNLYSFTNGIDGANPNGELVLAGNTLYGTTMFGGSANKGTIFKIDTDGTGFAVLRGFPGGWGEGSPFAGLVLSGNTLYGTTYLGGSAYKGTVFRINTDGTGFTNLYHFTGASDGANPYATLLVSGYTLYGTTSAGGSFNLGTVFSLTLPAPPRLAVVRSGTNVVLTWPTNASGFTLQSVTNLALPAAWTTVSPAPVVVSGQYTVTNPIVGAQKFYRLSQ
jgi:uncharacterized repeat protein (TIGR03803 family)